MDNYKYLKVYYNDILVGTLAKTPEILDSSRLRALGWKPLVDLKEGIRRAVGILEED